MLRFESIKLCLLVGGHDALFVLKDKVVAANDHALAAHAACNAMGYDILHLGVHLLMGNAALLGGTHHGVGHGVGEMLLQTCGQLQNFALVAAGEGNHIHHLRGSAGECAGLIKHDSVGLRQRFQIFAALDGDVIAAALAHGGEDGQRHGQLERTGKVHHQARDGAGDVAGEQIRHAGGTQTPGHQLVGQRQRTVLGAGLELFGFLDHGNDLIVAVGAALGFSDKDTLALLHNGAGIEGGALCLAHRHGLAGQSSLIHHGFAFQNGAVQRDHIAAAHHHFVAGAHLGERYQHFGALTAHPHLVHVQGHAASQIVQTLLAGPLFQQRAQVQQEHHRPGGGKVAAQDGHADGKSVQHFHFQPAAQHAAHTFPEKADGAEHRVSGIDGCRQEQLAQGAACHQIEHFILIFPVQPAAVGGGDKGIVFGHIELIACQNGNGSGALAGIGNDHIAGALVNGGMDDGIFVVQICFQHIGTVQSHADVFHMHTHPAFAFMQNGTFHISNILLYLFAAASGCYTLHACGPTLTKKSRPKAARKPRWGFQCFTNRKLLSGLFGGLGSGILDHSSLGFNSTSLVDGLCIGQNVTSLLLNLADGLHGGVLHAQHGSSGLGVDLLGILAGQQLETGRAEQSTGGEQCDLLDIHSNFPTFSISCQRPCTAGPVR